MKDFNAFLENIRKIAMEEGYDSLDETYVEHLRARYYGEDVIIGKTKSLILREIKPEDLDDFYNFEDAGQEEILGVFVKDTPEESRQNLCAYISHMYPMYDYGIWTVIQKSTGKIIGLCGLGQAEVKEACCTDIGYYISPKYRNHGYASECIQFVLDYAKNYLEFSCIYAIIKEENRISMGILCKFGFTCVEKDIRPDGMVSIYKRDLKERQ